MTCVVCGKEIFNGNEYIKHGDDAVCMDTMCRLEYMWDHITEAELDEYIAMCDETVAQQLRDGGIFAVSDDEHDLMLEWYESGDAIKDTCDGDEYLYYYESYYEDLERASRAEEKVLSRLSA